MLLNDTNASTAAINELLMAPPPQGSRRGDDLRSIHPPHLLREWDAFAAHHSHLAKDNPRVAKQLLALREHQARLAGSARLQSRGPGEGTGKALHLGAPPLNEGKDTCLRFASTGHCPTYRRTGKCAFAHPVEVGERAGARRLEPWETPEDYEFDDVITTRFLGGPRQENRGGV